MLHSDATLRQVRYHLLREIRSLYPDSETASMTRMILEHLDLSPAMCIAEPGRKADPQKVSQINEIVAELHTRRPIQYILGYAWFSDLKIGLNNKTLIPRPETEEMVGRIIRSLSRSPGCIIDLGTGSGCVALALKKSFPGSDVWGLDDDPGALQMAARNGQDNNLEVKWIRHNLLSDAPLPGGPGFDLVVSNPPYVTMGEREEIEAHVLDHEPAGALFVDDDDPLIYYRAIGRFCTGYLVPGGRLWVEINERFGKETAGMLESNGLRQTTIHTDIHGKERFISATG